MSPRLPLRGLAVTAGLFAVALLAVADPPIDLARHLALLGADRWHAAGFRGQGVKVAVLDNGFRGYRDHLGRALPAAIEARSFRRDGDLEARDSSHGVRCAEVLHAVAPDAELLLADWEPDNPARFLEAVRWARRQGARVVCCSTVMPGWSDGCGGGSAHAELTRALGDALFVAAAGNLAQRHWSGPFRADAGGFQAWVSGRVDNAVTPFGGELVTVDLGWPAGPRYELQVLDTTARPTVCGRAVVTTDGGWRSASLRFVPLPGHTYAARVQLLDGEPGPLRLVVLGGGLAISTERGSVVFPADGAEVLAVGAVTADGRRLPYSSCGTDPARPKPDCVAPVPFASPWRPEPFTGTSAAAPQAAALAALWWSRHPDWTAAQVRAALERTAIDLGPAGPDCETGFGLLRLPPG